MECDRRSAIELLPFILSDGGIYRGKELYFTTTDTALIERFRQAAAKAFNYKGYVVKRSNHSYVVKIKGEGYVRCIAEVAPGILCKPRCGVTLPSDLYEDLDLARWFIKVLASCDGGVSVSLGRKGKYKFLVRKVFITAKSVDIRTQVINILRELKFNPHDDKEKHVYLSAKNDIIRYAKEIRFLDGVKITRNSKRFHGLEKNHLLDLIVQSYDDPRVLTLLFQFPSSLPHQADLARAQRGLDTPVVPAVNDAGQLSAGLRARPVA